MPSEEHLSDKQLQGIAKMDGEDAAPRDVRVQSHFDACSICRRNVDAYRLLLAMLDAVVTPPSGFIGRVLTSRRSDDTERMAKARERQELVARYRRRAADAIEIMEAVQETAKLRPIERRTALKRMRRRLTGQKLHFFDSFVRRQEETAAESQRPSQRKRRELAFTG